MMYIVDLLREMCLCYWISLYLHVQISIYVYVFMYVFVFVFVYIDKGNLLSLPDCNLVYIAH